MRKISIWLAVVAVLLAAPVAALLALVEDRPRVTRLPEATPEVARRTHDLALALRRLDNDAVVDPPIRLRVDQLGAALDFAARLVPGLRPEVTARPGALTLRLSLPLDMLPGGGWLNTEAVVPSHDGLATFASVRIGPLDLPPALATALGEGIANLVLGGGMGTHMRDAVARLEVGGDSLTAHVRFAPGAEGVDGAGLFALLRPAAMPDPSDIRARYIDLRAAIDAGRLPDRGSFVPYLRYLVGTARDTAAPGEEDRAFAAGLLAMARACADDRVRVVLGRLVAGSDGADGPWRRDCGALRLAGRADTRKHFITAAAIKAVSTMRMSFAIGEFKELADSLDDDGAFDFTDIAANASGIRFAETVMATPPEEWAGLLDRIEGEGSVLAAFDGLPGRMPWRSFERRFDRVDSPAYRALVARIEGRIDRLALHAPAP